MYFRYISHEYFFKTQQKILHDYVFFMTIRENLNVNVKIDLDPSVSLFRPFLQKHNAPSLLFKQTEAETRPTCQDSAGDPRDALDLRHVVVHEVLVAGGVEEGRVAEHAPQLGGDGAVGRLDGLGAHVKRLPHQRAVAQDAHAGRWGNRRRRRRRSFFFSFQFEAAPATGARCFKTKKHCVKFRFARKKTEDVAES